MLSVNETEYISGILPVFSQWTVFNECDRVTSEEKFSIAVAKDFLTMLGFWETNEYVAHFLAHIIAKNANAERVALGDEYSAYAQNQSVFAFRSQIAYYIDKNFDRVKNNVKKLFDFPTDHFHKNIKNFTETLGMLLSREKHNVN